MLYNNILTGVFLITGFFTLVISAKIPAGGNEFSGQFTPVMVANDEDFERVIFTEEGNGNYKSIPGVGADSHLTVGRLYAPQTGSASVTTVLVENSNDAPFVYVDLNEDRNFTADEKITLQQEKKDNPFLWNATVNLPIKNNSFTHAGIFLRYYKRVQTEKMSPGDRLLAQSTEVFASGAVDVRGKKISVQYAYDFGNKKIDPQNGWLGIDGNDDGKIDMSTLSSEAAKASKETVIFRVGQNYFSTAKADVNKNQIVLREHEAKDYKRIELQIGMELPDFEFVDFDGKKRRFSEFRGKYVIVDFWGLWCPPCRQEMPYLRESYKRFKDRKLEILGMNTDPESPSQVKEVLSKAQMNWTQAKLESIFDLVNTKLRIESFPTTFLVSPEGKLLSMSRHTRDELDLRGEDLLTTLDKILPK